MRISTFIYCLRQGLKNICRNIWFSLASTATISACIFLFCLFFSVIINVQYIVKHVESTVGITVLFDESLAAEQIQAIGDQIRARKEIKSMLYISAEEAWEKFQKEYFAGHEELAAGFAQDNPLAGSASYTLFLNDISSQDRIVEYLNGIDGVRQVNYSNTAVAGFSNFNKIIGLLSGAIILVLLAVSVFLISNTISVAAAFRRTENQIMRMIGATNYMIRAPFVVEGIVIGLLGAVIPLVCMYFLYLHVVEYIMTRFRIFAGIIMFLPVEAIFPTMMAVALALGVGIGFIGSFFTIRKHLKV